MFARGHYNQFNYSVVTLVIFIGCNLFICIWPFLGLEINQGTYNDMNEYTILCKTDASKPYAKCKVIIQIV